MSESSNYYRVCAQGQHTEDGTTMTLDYRKDQSGRWTLKSQNSREYSVDVVGPPDFEMTVEPLSTDWNVPPIISEKRCYSRGTEGKSTCQKFKRVYPAQESTKGKENAEKDEEPDLWEAEGKPYIVAREEEDAIDKISGVSQISSANSTMKEETAVGTSSIATSEVPRAGNIVSGASQSSSPKQPTKREPSVSIGSDVSNVRRTVALAWNKKPTTPMFQTFKKSGGR